MSLRAYAKLYKNDGAMTPGTTEETVDGMSQVKIAKIIDAIRYERWHWTPVRRVEIPKSNGKMRPLGMPTWTDKMVQEVIRSILEAYYAPQFSEHSHGFRPNKGCHTALNTIHKTWKGTKWFIEGDIEGCFDNIDHTKLMHILQDNIKDNRFLRLIEGALKAGDCEEWKYHPTRSGSPQGGGVSPILSNIYMDRLDKYIENTLIPEYTRGERHGGNPAYARLWREAWKQRKKGNLERAKALRKEMQQHTSVDPNDQSYRRLRYERYADDFLLGLNFCKLNRMTYSGRHTPEVREGSPHKEAASMPTIVDFPAIVQKALATFGDLFDTEPARRHFAEYLTGLIVAENKTVSGINREFVVTTDQSCLNRWLTEVSWDVQALNDRRLAWLQQDPKTRYSARGVIAIDNTLVDHTGKLIDDAGWFWDHAHERYVLPTIM